MTHLRHLQADCLEPGSAPERSVIETRVGLWATFFTSNMDKAIWQYMHAATQVPTL